MTLQSLSSEARQEAAATGDRQQVLFPSPQPRKTTMGQGVSDPADQSTSSGSLTVTTTMLAMLQATAPPSFHPIRGEKSGDYLLWQCHEPRSFLQSHKDKNSETVSKSDEP